jgi:uncharacterized protein
MKMNNIIIFTRNPELGKVKTRLARDLGNEKTLFTYKYLLEHTRNIVNKVDICKSIYYSEEIIEQDIWNISNSSKHLQKGNDLGEKMKNAFFESFNRNCNKTLIIGSDLLDLNENHILTALEKLDSCDVVFGPATDGGYYLLGMNKMIPSLFNNKDWGTNTVLKDSLENLKNYKVKFIEELNDIDYLDDLKNCPSINQHKKLKSIIDNAKTY